MTFLLILSCLVLVNGGLCLYPTGAPAEACQNMTPHHLDFQAQPNPSPYSHEIVKINAIQFNSKCLKNLLFLMVLN